MYYRFREGPFLGPEGGIVGTISHIRAHEQPVGHLNGGNGCDVVGQTELFLFFAAARAHLNGCRCRAEKSRLGIA
jgi:hypothetical protein